MKYKVGDTVRIQSLEWLDRNYYPKFARELAGKIAIITGVQLFNKVMWFRTNLDDGEHLWNEDEFDPDYRPDEPLSPEDAIRAMLDGETLYDKEGEAYSWREDFLGAPYFVCNRNGEAYVNSIFFGLRRHPEKRTRPMSREEMVAWSLSEESHGWMVRCGGSIWTFPRHFSYTGESEDYQRAHLLPDLSDVDPDTVQRFEVEE